MPTRAIRQPVTKGAHSAGRKFKCHLVPPAGESTFGRELSTAWPTGTIVDSSYFANGWLERQSVSGTFGAADITQVYDAFGLPAVYDADVNGNGCGSAGVSR